MADVSLAQKEQLFENLSALALVQRFVLNIGTVASGVAQASEEQLQADGAVLRKRIERFKDGVFLAGKIASIALVAFQRKIIQEQLPQLVGDNGE